MNDDFRFWVMLVGAALLRVATSPFHSIWRAILSVLTSVFLAWVFTDAVIDWLHLSAVTYRAPMGALIALTADGLLRVILRAARDPLKYLAEIRRGKE